MNYKKIYERLMDRAKGRIIEGYTENHHIIPRCMNGTDDIENIVSLTAEEHYIAHLLLVKIYPKNTSLWYAANMMMNRNNKNYAWVKKQHAINVSTQFSGYKHTIEAKDKMKKAIAERWQGDIEGFKEEQRRRASNPKKKKDGYFKPKTKEHAKNISKAALKRPRLDCPYCDRKITKANYNKHLETHK